MPRAPSHTRLQHRVTNAKDCPPWPPLPVHLAEIVLNPIRGTLANNDLHEFLGDRVMRVFVVKISEQYAKSVSHLTRVTQTLCTNDTFGRLAYSLGLHTHAKLTPSQQESIKAWNPSSWESPPKVLADLFEALIGGIYSTYGMRGIREWLEAFFDSLDSDTWKDLSLPVHVVPVQEPRPKSRKETWITSVEQDLLVNWIRANSSSIWVQATHFLDELRPGFSVHSTTYPLKAEVGDAHLRLFICNEIIRRYPWYLQAASGASHLATVRSSS
ncbi:hypothetical protein SISNIDRAFT_406986 [Sistotremastrum niveocremeum HHB9708]|uniref:RNase III domain-containing protein n=1 Tax=Sistotremastrum niveocremeum HHB9708 TaxID=1314777 RepID=A0A164Y6F1_9AGAM|nr:hypothetical protein SISNIDRAFT_406986 [Sistotremastrum niveocremeum HHB9708]